MMQFRLFIFMYLWLEVQLLNDTLVLVHVVFRHCERTPDKEELYSKSPYYDESNFAPYGYGQLTNQGKKKCYDIGTALRKRYNNFLNPSYHYTLVEGISSDYDRTKESLQLVLAGLFPPTEELKWLQGMNWTPIATVYEKKEKDKVFFPFEKEKYNQEMENFQQTKEAQAIVAPYEDLMEYFSQHIQEPVDFKRLSFIARGLEHMISLGFKLPEWLNQTEFNRAKQSSVKFYSYAVGTKQLRRIVGGYLFKKIIENIDMKINGSLVPASRRMFIYGVHAYSMQILFILMDIWDTVSFPVGSYYLFEVHYIDGKYGLKLFYQNYATNEPQHILIPGFGEFASIEELKIGKRDFLQLDDLDESSLSTTISLSSAFPLLLLSLISLLF